MHLTSLHLDATDLDAQATFYGDAWGLPVARPDARTVTVQIGATELRFVQSEQTSSPRYHYAINVPENAMNRAKMWLRERVSTVLEDTGGQEFHFEDWNAHAIYFYDPDGNLGELIARHELPNATDAPFDARHLLCVSEIGLITEDVPGLVATLGIDHGLTRYREGSAEFVPVGDANGLFIVVKQGRLWFPTREHPAEPGRVTAVFTNGAGEVHELRHLP